MLCMFSLLDTGYGLIILMACLLVLPKCLQGVVRVENLEDATEHVDQVLDRVKPEYLVSALH